MVAGWTGCGGRRLVLGVFVDLYELPTLRARNRLFFCRLHAGAVSGGGLLILNLVLDRLAHGVAFAAVLHALLDLDDDGLVHLVGHNVTTCGLASVALGSSGLGVRGLRHHLPSSLASAGFGRMSSSRSLSTV